MSIESQEKAEVETVEPEATSDAGSAGTVEPSNPQAYMIDVETIRDTVSVARASPVSADARPHIATTTATLIGQVELLLVEDLGFDLKPAVRGLYRDAYRLLCTDRRPTSEDPTFVAWEYMRDVAALTSQLVDVYAEQQGGVKPDGL